MQVNYKRLSLFLVFTCILLGSSLKYVVLSQGTNIPTITSGPYAGAPSYTVYKEGSVYYAKNAYGNIDYEGTNLSAVIQPTLTSGNTMIITEGTYTFTTTQYSLGDGAHKIGVYLTDNLHIIICKGAIVTQANGLKLEVFFAGHLWGTGSGVPLNNVTIEVYGLIDGNYAAQGYTSPTDFQACPIALYASFSSFPIIKAEHFGRYGALVLYGSFNDIGQVYASNSLDAVNHQANAIDLERCEEINIGRVIGACLDGKGVNIPDGGSNIAIGMINTYGCWGNLLITTASSLAVKGISVGQVVSAGHYGAFGYGIVIDTADGYGQVSDITIDSAIINGAAGDGIKIVLADTTSALVKRVLIGKAILFNNKQHAGNDGALALKNCTDVNIGLFIAYDDQTPKTQYWGMKFGGGVTNFLCLGGDITGNTDEIDGFTEGIQGHIENLVGYP